MTSVKMSVCLLLSLFYPRRHAHIHKIEIRTCGFYILLVLFNSLSFHNERFSRSLKFFKDCIFFFFFNFYLFLAVLGLRCCTRAFSSCGERGLLFVVVRGLMAVASLVVEHGL